MRSLRGLELPRAPGRPRERGPTLSNFTADSARALPGPRWLERWRTDAFERFAAVALPRESEEVWRYSRIDDLDLDAYDPPPGRPPAEPDLPDPVAALLDAAAPACGVVVTRNGSLVRAELSGSLEEQGVSLGGPDGVEAAQALGSVADGVDAFVDLNGAFVVDPVVLDVPAKVAVADPLVVVHWVDEERRAVFPRTVVRVGEAGEAHVLEVTASPDIAALVAPVLEASVGDGADASYTSAQVLGPRVWHLAYQSSRVGREARLRSLSVGIGGDYARVRTDSRLVGQSGTAELSAAYFGGGCQVHDFRTLQDHDAPRTRSDLLFKGAVTDDARSVYSGLIRVRRGAIGTDAYQVNRNLVLSEGAHADSVPNLDIEENDVRCSHASAVGPVDEEQLYYLESRGVPPPVASRLIVEGFFEEVLGRTPIRWAHAFARAEVAARLAASPGAGLGADPGHSAGHHEAGR